MTNKKVVRRRRYLVLIRNDDAEALKFGKDVDDFYVYEERGDVHE